MTNPNDKHDPARRVDLARRFLVTSGTSDTARRTVAMIAKTHGATLEDVEAELPASLEELTRMWVERAAEIYAEMFTEEQLDVLLVFSETETARVLRNLTPRLNELGEQAMAKIIAEASS